MKTVTLKNRMVVEVDKEKKVRIRRCPAGFIHVNQPTRGVTLLEEGKTYEGEGVIEKDSLFLDQG
jgi:hypothetical protein